MSFFKLHGGSIMLQSLSRGISRNYRPWTCCAQESSVQVWPYQYHAYVSCLELLQSCNNLAVQLPLKLAHQFPVVLAGNLWIWRSSDLERHSGNGQGGSSSRLFTLGFPGAKESCGCHIKPSVSPRSSLKETQRRAKASNNFGATQQSRSGLCPFFVMIYIYMYVLIVEMCQCGLMRMCMSLHV